MLYLKQLNNIAVPPTGWIKAIRNALGMSAQQLGNKLVYGFVPLDGSLEELIERKAREMAEQIVGRTNATMKLEEQENSQQRIEKAIEERTIALKNEMPKSLWD